MNLKEIKQRIIGRVRREVNKPLIRRMKSQLQVDNFTILSQNCIGGVFYHDMGLPFQSPTINLYFSCPDFVKFVLNLEYYLSIKIQVIDGEEYPIGYLGDLKIHFVHYDSCREAYEKWEERKNRVQWDRIIVFCTDMENFDKTILNEWEKIKYPKVLFSARDWNTCYNICLQKYEKKGRVPDLIPRREFYSAGKLLYIINQSFLTSNGEKVNGRYR